MSRGGKREGSGRKKGGNNQNIKRLRSAMREVAIIMGEKVPGSFEGDAHAFMVAVYKHPGFPVELRLDAASRAARYEKPTLAAVEHMGKGGGPIEFSDARDRLAHLVSRETATGDAEQDPPTIN